MAALGTDKSVWPAPIYQSLGTLVFGAIRGEKFVQTKTLLELCGITGRYKV